MEATRPSGTEDLGVMDPLVEELLENSAWADLTPAALLQTSSNNNYVNDLKKKTGLHILQAKRVKKAYKDKGLLGLFHLFFTKSLCDTLRSFTNVSLQNDGKDTISEGTFLSYIGLEIAMSIVIFGDIKEYWSTKMFLGHTDFQAVMSRNKFQTIRSHVCFMHPDRQGDRTSLVDPLWSSRLILNNFLKQAAATAVPVGTVALDENTVKTKARTRARSYLPSKPDPYGIRFYACVGNKYAYLHNFCDNGSGNTSGISRSNYYTSIFRSLRTPHDKAFPINDPIGVNPNSPTALWVMQLSHLVQCDNSPIKTRVAFTDNFYTRPLLAKYLLQVTDGNMRIVGTIKFTNIDGMNRILLSKAICELKDSPRGSWKLVRTFDKTRESEKERVNHNQQQKKAT